MRTVLLAMFLAAACFAQSTVTVNVVDAGGQAWNNGTWSAKLQGPQSQINGPFYVGNTLLGPTQTTFTGSMNGSGTFVQGLTQTNTITSPIGSQWLITVCPAATATCYAQGFAVNTSPQTINLQPPAIGIVISTGVQAFAPPARVAAYQASEILGASLGNFYYDLTREQLGVCESLPCGWVYIAGGGGGSLSVQTNGSLNADQTLLNHVNSTGAGGLNWTNPSGGIEKASVANIQGSDANLLSSGTVSASPAVSLCTDGNGGATTTGCPAALGGVTGSGTVPLLPVWVTSTSLGNSSVEDTGSQVVTLEPVVFDHSTTWAGSSGQATLQVAAAAGTPNPINLPTSTGAAGSLLTSDGGNPQQTSWIAKSALGFLSTVETNSTLNSSQSLLNFTNANGCTWSNPSGGVEEVNCVGTTISIDTNGSPNTSQTVLNFQNSSGTGQINFSNPSGGVENAVVANIQGTDSNLLSAGTVSGTSVPLCTDASGGATTASCANALWQANDMYMYVPGTYAGSQVLFYSVPVRNVTIPSGLTSSHFGCVPGLTTPTGSVTVTLEKNGSSIGTIAFSASSCTPSSVTFSAPVSFNGTSDTFEVVAPVSPDATFSNFFADIWATRSN